jgi:hypothetical protein
MAMQKWQATGMSRLTLAMVFSESIVLLWPTMFEIQPKWFLLKTASCREMSELHDQPH